MNIELRPAQLKAANSLVSGSILCGGVGTGKSRTSLFFFFCRICGGKMKVNDEGEYRRAEYPVDLYIITTARKRDSLEWEKELADFGLAQNTSDTTRIRVVVDSWNNIKKYTDVECAFFIFDEQRLVGSGTWVKSFYKIARNNRWILLSATPGDKWHDYIPVFVANGFYRNKTEFEHEHVSWKNFRNYRLVDRYLGLRKLEVLRKRLLVTIPIEKHTERHTERLRASYDVSAYFEIHKKRWNPETQAPIKNAGELCGLLRKVVGRDSSKIRHLMDVMEKRGRVIVFYNYDWELEILRGALARLEIPFSEWNGHKHEPILETEQWVYLVQYTAGAEGWNCVTCDTVVFFSDNYSYKVMEQAAGRIDRMNTPFTDLWYYHIRSDAPIDRAVASAIRQKRAFSESIFAKNRS
nr:MAG TPA: Chromatin remodeling complex ATPase [Caudoviricetes sp.]